MMSVAVRTNSHSVMNNMTSLAVRTNSHTNRIVHHKIIEEYCIVFHVPNSIDDIRLNLMAGKVIILIATRM